MADEVVVSDHVQRQTLDMALAMVRPTEPTFELFLPDSAPLVNESPVDRLRNLEISHPVPHAWEVDLRELSPISTKVDWLAFRWSDGSEKDPINRWMLYSCSPTMNPEIRARLGGVPWWEMPKGQQVGRRMLVSAYQWEMYRKHQVWARPFWCLQGTDGGTPAVYSEKEQKLLKLDGQPTDPPAYGSLPYAGWSDLTKIRIQERTQLWKLGRALHRMTEQGIAEHLKRETADAERQFRKKFLAWTKDRFQAQADFLEWYTRKTEADMTLRQATPGEMLAGEQLDESYIEHGVVPYAHDLNK